MKEKVFSPEILRKLKEVPWEKEVFFPPKEGSRPFSRREIGDIFLNQAAYEERLALFDGLGAQFVQIGSRYGDWLPLLGRNDLLEEMMELSKKRGYIPLFISHWTSLVLPLVRDRGFAAYIVPINKKWGLLNQEDALRTIRETSGKIIAMKPLARGELADDLLAAFDFLFRTLGVSSVLIGLCLEQEAEMTCGALREVFPLKARGGSR